MKSDYKKATKKKDLKKSKQKEKISNGPTVRLRKNPKVDTDFHHAHPFKEQ